jgi:APA family basic amino acid/polyamine antiporter
METGLSTQNLVAILVVVLLSVINVTGLKTGALIQNVFTFAKVSALLGLVFLGLFIGRNAQALAANFQGNFWHNASLGAQHAVQVGVGGPTVLVGTLTILAVAQVGSLFSADAWNNVTFTAGEVKNPSRNLPLSLALGTGVVIALYVACNFIYLNILPLDGSAAGATILERGIKYATEDRVGTAVMSQMLGATGGTLMAVAVMLSTFGCCNGLILAGSRVYYAMAKDGLFSRAWPNCILRTRPLQFRSWCRCSGLASFASLAVTDSCSTTSSSPCWFFISSPSLGCSSCGAPTPMRNGPTGRLVTLYFRRYIL